jgi:hypothetical protein
MGVLDPITPEGINYPRCVGGFLYTLNAGSDWPQSTGPVAMGLLLFMGDRQVAKKTELVNFRLSSQERRLLQDVAREQKTTQSAFLREAIRQAACVYLDAGQYQQQQSQAT